MLRTLSILVCLVLQFGFSQSNSLPTVFPVERTLAANEDHTYRLQAKAGEFIHVRVEQLGSDVTLRLSGANGNSIAEINRLRGPGTEDIPWILAEAAELVVNIKAVSPGGYKLAIDRRIPTGQDISRVEAFKGTWIDAMAILKEGESAAVRQRAVKKLEEAIPLWRKASDTEWEGEALHNLAVCYALTSRWKDAKKTVLLALPLRRASKDLHGIATTLNVLAGVHGELGEYAEQESPLKEALRIREQIGDQIGVGNTLNSIGRVHTRLGNAAKAEEIYSRALAIQHETGDKRGEGTTLTNIALIYRNGGDFKNALQRFLEARTIFQSIGDAGKEADSLNALGQLYSQLGDRERAAEYLRLAATEYDRQGDLLGLASTQHYLGFLRSEAEDSEGSLPFFERALELRTKAGSQMGQAAALAGICTPLVKLGKLERATQVGAQALEISRRIKSRDIEGASLFCLGKLEMKRSNPSLANQYFEEATVIYRSLKNNDSLSTVLTVAAQASEALGKLDEATVRIEEAITIAEMTRRTVGNPTLRASYRSTRASRLEMQTDLLMRQKFDSKALEAVEASRARSLAEMLSDNRSGGELTEPQKKQEEALTRSLSTIQRELFQDMLAPARKTELKRQLAKVVREKDLFEFELQQSTEFPETLDAAAIRESITTAGNVLIEYSLGEKQSYVWVVQSSGVASFVLPGRKMIEAAVQSYRKELAFRATVLTATSAMVRLDAQSRNLYKILIAPFASNLAEANSIIIVPDGVLAYLPFETLLGPARMIEQFSIQYAPSASTLAQLRTRGIHRPMPEKALLAFGDPVYQSAAKPSAAARELTERGFDFVPLPNTRSEVKAIQSLFKPDQSQIFLGGQANEAALKSSRNTQYRYFHFATHGYFDEEQNWRSGIVLSLNSASTEDGVLQAQEIMKLKLSADMVTLSACQSGLGTVVAGEGVMGLSRAFLYAGAQSLVVSLWNVNDAATAELMKTFYGNLNRGIHRAEALRQAKLKLMRSGSAAWRHPYYWAPFVFIGDSGQQSAAKLEHSLRPSKP